MRFGIDKKLLIEMLTEKTEKELELARLSAQETYDAATNEESKPENEYDTRALEASYLAMAQSKRISELEELLTIYKFISVKDFKETDPIGPTALVTVDLNGKKSLIFLLPKGGGQSVNFQGQQIQIVTATSPLGEALLGLKCGDIATVEMGPQVREYEIISVR